MFPEDQPEIPEECTFSSDFVDLLNTWEPTREGLDLHLLSHMLGVILMQLRRYFTPFTMIGYVYNVLSSVEQLLADQDYLVPHADGTVQKISTPEWRALLEAEIDNLEIPDDLTGLEEA